MITLSVRKDKIISRLQNKHLKIGADPHLVYVSCTKPSYGLNKGPGEVGSFRYHLELEDTGVRWGRRRDSMGTASTGAKRIQDADEPTADEINARLDHISTNLHPITPYILRIPSNKPVEFNQEHQRQFWIKSTLFPYDEGHLQYVSNFNDWGQGLIQPVGGWDDGKGGIATPETTLRSALMTPQQPAKKLKLGDYARRKVNSENRAPSSQSSSSTERTKIVKLPISERQKSLSNSVNRNVKRRAVDISDDLAKAESRSLPARESHESLLPEEDLPPPLTPLPPSLAAAVAEYREHFKDSASSTKNRQTRHPNPAARAYTEYSRQLDRISHANTTGQNKRCFVTLKFRKLSKQFRKLVHDFTMQDEQNVQSSRAFSYDSLDRLKQLGEDLMKEAKSVGRDQKSIFLELEAILCSLAYSILNKQNDRDACKQWENMMRLLSEFADQHLVKNNRSGRYDYVHADERSDEELGLIYHLVDSLMCLIHRQLAQCHLAALSQAYSTDMALWLKAEALEYAIKASKDLGPKRIASRYPKVWEDSSDASIPQEPKISQDWMTVIVTGPFSFPLAECSVLEGVRGARRLLMKCRHEAGIEAEDQLGAFAVKFHATA